MDDVGGGGAVGHEESAFPKSMVANPKPRRKQRAPRTGVRKDYRTPPVQAISASSGFGEFGGGSTRGRTQMNGLFGMVNPIPEMPYCENPKEKLMICVSS